MTTTMMMMMEVIEKEPLGPHVVMKFDHPAPCSRRAERKTLRAMPNQTAAYRPVESKQEEGQHERHQNEKKKT
jgi:hypothetical protein